MTDPWSSILAYIWINILARWSETDCIIRSCLRKVFVLSLMLVTKSWWDFFTSWWFIFEMLKFMSKDGVCCWQKQSNLFQTSSSCLKNTLSLTSVFASFWISHLYVATGWWLIFKLKKFYDRNKHTAFDIENCYFGHWNTAWCWKLLQGCKKGCFGNFLILKNFDDL